MTIQSSNVRRIAAGVALAGTGILLSGCIVAPVGPRPYAVYPSRQVYVQPAPVVVVPAPYYGYRNYRRYP